MSELPKRIQLKGDRHFEERVAAGAITPGMLISLTSANKVVKHPTAGARTSPAFALEDALQGRTILDAYAADELVFYTIARPGDHIYALIADGENIAIGDKLSSNGDGTLQKLAGSEYAIAEALEVCDLSESSNTAAGRCAVSII